MSRRGNIKKRTNQNQPDPIYNNRTITRMINRIMKDGKKTIAQAIVYDALDLIKAKTEQDPIKVFEQALQNVGPRMEVRPRRVGGASYQVPQEVRGDRKVALAVRWILGAATKLSNREFRTFADKLANELILASKGEGEAIRKRDSTLKMAEANRAFAHFRW